MDLSIEMAELWQSLGAPPAGRPLAIEFIAARDGEGVSTVAREFAFTLARRERRRVWLIDLDLMGQSQAQVFADDPRPLRRARHRPRRRARTARCSSPYSRRSPDRTAAPGPTPATSAPTRSAAPGFWVTRFRREALRPHQGVHVTPTPAYWTRAEEARRRGRGRRARRAALTGRPDRRAAHGRGGAGGGRRRGRPPRAGPAARRPGGGRRAAARASSSTACSWRRQAS